MHLIKLLKHNKSTHRLMTSSEMLVGITLKFFPEQSTCALHFPEQWHSCGHRPPVLEHPSPVHIESINTTKRNKYRHLPFSVIVMFLYKVGTFLTVKDALWLTGSYRYPLSYHGDNRLHSRGKTVNKDNLHIEESLFINNISIIGYCLNWSYPSFDNTPPIHR